MINVYQTIWHKGAWSKPLHSSTAASKGTQLVLVFGDKWLLEDQSRIQSIEEAYPKATRVYCSTAGEIYQNEVYDESVAVHVLTFDHTRLQAESIPISMHSNFHAIGQELMTRLNAPDLRYVLIMADGGMVNGSELVRGVNDTNPFRVPVTGGLAADADRFEYTLVGLNQHPARGQVLAIGFYGDCLHIGCASRGGWDVFGPERTVTRSASNRLYEIDQQPALALYKKYLGKHAAQLPASALLFPLAVRNNNNNDLLVRTILSIDPEEGSMLFAGDIPEGAPVRFMKANFDKLVEAVSEASQELQQKLGNNPAPAVALLISCVGRKMILNKRIDEEIEAVREVMGPNLPVMGFYSYGELSPFSQAITCGLHNQTMTITTLSETD
jgi:hypothetical protein